MSTRDFQEARQALRDARREVEAGVGKLVRAMRFLDLYEPVQMLNVEVRDCDIDTPHSKHLWGNTFFCRGLRDAS